MFINPIVVGVCGTLLVEMAVFIIAVIVWNKKNK